MVREQTEQYKPCAMRYGKPIGILYCIFVQLWIESRHEISGPLHFSKTSPSCSHMIYLKTISAHLLPLGGRREGLGKWLTQLHRHNAATSCPAFGQRTLSRNCLSDGYFIKPGSVTACIAQTYPVGPTSFFQVGKRLSSFMVAFGICTRAAAWPAFQSHGSRSGLKS